MKALATYSIKGGVGKTTAAVNLAAAAAGAGWRVLLWDLDPQGAATYLLRVKPRIKGGGDAVVRRKRALDAAVKATDVANLDLVPADFRNRHLDLALNQLKHPTRRLRRIVRSVSDDYDWVVLDCAPSISLVSEGVFEAVDGLLVPLVPSPLSVRTLDQLIDFVDRHGPPTGRPAVLGFLSMVDRRRALHRDLLESLPVDRAEVLATHVPSESAVERMGIERAPLVAYAPRAVAVEAFACLWADIQARWPAP